jgi:hypothetical protein
MDTKMELNKDDNLNNKFIDINEFEVPSFSTEIFNKNKVFYNKVNDENYALLYDNDNLILYSTFFSLENNLFNSNLIEKEDNYIIDIEENENISINDNKSSIKKKEKKNIIQNKKKKEKNKGTFLKILNHSIYVHIDDFIKLINSKRKRKNF